MAKPPVTSLLGVDKHDHTHLKARKKLIFKQLLLLLKSKITILKILSKNVIFFDHYI